MNDSIIITEHGARPVVSFCIPVYNNAEAARKIVEGILVSEDLRFEAVMCDDASSDNAQELLSQIDDPRFHYHRNASNLGPHRNWLKALSLGQGEWLYLVMGRDRINGEHIGRLIELLGWAEENGVTLLEDGYSNRKKPVMYSGIDAIIHFLATKHPTGTIIPRSLFETIPNDVKEYYFTHFDTFPENYLRRDMLLRGKGLSIMSGVYVRKGDFYYKKNPSTVETSSNIYDMYGAPRRKTDQMLGLIDMVDAQTGNTFTEAELDRHFGAQFFTLLYKVSVGWALSCRNKEGMAYHGHEVKYITVSEMVGNIREASRKTKLYLESKNKLTAARKRIMRIRASEMLTGGFAYYFVRIAAQKILEPLGIWAFLRKLRKKYIPR